MLNRRGQSEGFSWFFAIIAIAFILLIFYLSVSLTGLLSKSPTANIVLGDFDSVKNLAAYSFLYDSLKLSIYNVDEKVISDKFFNFISVYYFDKNTDCYGFKLGKNYFGQSSSGQSKTFVGRPVDMQNWIYKMIDSFEPGDSSVSVLTNKGFDLSGIKIGGCDE